MPSTRSTANAYELSRIRTKLRAMFVLYNWDDGPVMRDGCTRFVTRGGSLTAKITRSGAVSFKENGHNAVILQYPVDQGDIEEWIMGKSQPSGGIDNELILIGNGQSRIVVYTSPNPATQDRFLLAVEATRLGGRREAPIPLTREQLTTVRDQLTNVLELMPAEAQPYPFQVGDNVTTVDRGPPVSDLNTGVYGGRHRRWYDTGVIEEIVRNVNSRSGPSTIYSVRFNDGALGTYNQCELEIVRDE